MRYIHTGPDFVGQKTAVAYMIILESVDSNFFKVRDPADLESRGQVDIYKTFLIVGCLHNTNMIVGSISKFSRLGISPLLNYSIVPDRMTFEVKIKNTQCLTLLSSDCIIFYFGCRFEHFRY